ncbi:MAG: maleylpyruvate isomerase family mycothiol-dependent enzyme [Jatrophihabitantaceae bacterium]
MSSPPTAQLAAIRASTAELLLGLAAEKWSDADARAASLLPGWTRGHVLTHLARNADGIARTLSGALRGAIVPRYPSGRTGRDADIEAGSARGIAELITDVQESADRLDRVFGAVADADGWALPTDDRTAGDYLLARWREVEIHRVDLAGSYTAAQWPPGFLALMVPELAQTLGERASVAVRAVVTAEGSSSHELAGRSWTAGGADPVEVAGPDWALLAWLLGRASVAAAVLTAVPDLSPWR